MAKKRERDIPSSPPPIKDEDAREYPKPEGAKSGAEQGGGVRGGGLHNDIEQACYSRKYRLLRRALVHDMAIVEQIASDDHISPFDVLLHFEAAYRSRETIGRPVARILRHSPVPDPRWMCDGPRQTTANGRIDYGSYHEHRFAILRSLVIHGLMGSDHEFVQADPWLLELALYLEEGGEDE